jgi:DNA-binding MarR family transcriptional regulator
MYYNAHAPGAVTAKIEPIALTKVKTKQSTARSPSGQLFTELVLEIFRFNGRLILVGDRLTKSIGLSTARWQTLGAIAHSDSPLTVADIARNMGLQRQSVQQTVNALVEAGIVMTHDNPNHQRARLVSITKKGRVTFEDAMAVQASWANETAAGLPEADFQKVLQTLRSLRTRLEHPKPKKGRDR